MLIIRKRLTVLLLVFSNVALSQTYAEKYQYYIKKEELKEHLIVLASDSLEGRATGKKGQKEAANFIKNKFQEMDVAPAISNNKYFQTYTVVSVFPSGKLGINEDEFSFYNDFIFFEESVVSKLSEKEIIYIPIHAKNKNEINVTNKVVVLTDKEVEDFDNVALRDQYETYKKRGAAAVLFISPTFFSLKNDYQEQLTEPYKLLETDIIASINCPLIFGSEQLMSSLPFSKRSLRCRSKGRKLKKVEELGSFSISFNPDTTHLHGENVIAKIDGNKTNKEHLVIMAHYDHLGVDSKGAVYNGADDNGTGTAALLALAKAFKIAESQKDGPDRAVLFMAVSGEEIGLLGSRYYTENALLPLEETVSVLNIDMIGRTDSIHKDNPDYVYVIGSDFLSSDLHQINETANKKHTKLKLDYTYNNKSHPYTLYYRSDHFNFAKHGIPSIFYFGGFHEDYHRTTDTEDKIEYDKLEKITKLVFFTAWELSNNNQRPVVDSKPK